MSCICSRTVRGVFLGVVEPDSDVLHEKRCGFVFLPQMDAPTATTRSASAAIRSQARAAFRQLALLVHPDKNPHPRVGGRSCLCASPTCLLVFYRWDVASRENTKAFLPPRLPPLCTSFDAVALLCLAL